ncbi:helix-turn-helix transcriptional regulator [Rhodospirillaceae bacterium KN72]|uniref:Helix-turn-helix transcriptional regulator n=1 Tax=Pacificispira spongiicola TaxID=2729598 RepID=A0A7Y0HFL3_9PROT|nr:helix-turn-helix transcriptional regulator [Pacificispira spongiicola]NMM45996.1 helix-turn-helix transcriptional regulator [Pacificispira spongiicola]
MITAAQIRAGRSLLNIKQSELAKAAGVSLATLNNIERGVGDPRASTLDAIERALFQAGIDVETDGAVETVRLHRLARPSAYETLHASQRVLEALSRDSLLKVERILFYGRRDHAQRDESPKICLLLEGRARAVLFDQVSFTVSSGARMAEMAGLLLASFALHRGNLFYLDRLTEDTTLVSVSEATDRLRAADWRGMDHPSVLIDTVDNWDEKVALYGERQGHPLAELIRLVGPRIEGALEAGAPIPALTAE